MSIAAPLAWASQPQHRCHFVLDRNDLKYLPSLPNTPWGQHHPGGEPPPEPCQQKAPSTSSCGGSQGVGSAHTGRCPQGDGSEVNTGFMGPALLD